MRYYGWFVDALDCNNFYLALIPRNEKYDPSPELEYVKSKEVSYTEEGKVYADRAYLCHLARTKLSGNRKDEGFRTLKFISLKWFQQQECWVDVESTEVDDKGRLLVRVTSLVPMTTYPYRDIVYTPPETLRSYLRKVSEKTGLTTLVFEGESPRRRRSVSLTQERVLPCK